MTMAFINYRVIVASHKTQREMSVNVHDIL